VMAARRREGGSASVWKLTLSSAKKIDSWLIGYIRCTNVAASGVVRWIGKLARFSRVD